MCIGLHIKVSYLSLSLSLSYSDTGYCVLVLLLLLLLWCRSVCCMSIIDNVPMPNTEIIQIKFILAAYYFSSDLEYNQTISRSLTLFEAIIVWFLLLTGGLGDFGIVLGSKAEMGREGPIKYSVATTPSD